MVQQFADHQPQHGVAKEFEPLVVWGATAAMGQGEAQQPGVRERITAEFVRLAAALSHHRYARQSRELS